MFLSPVYTPSTLTNNNMFPFVKRYKTSRHVLRYPLYRSSNRYEYWLWW